MPVTHHPDQQCFEIIREGQPSTLKYRFIDDNTVDFYSTYVPESQRGTGTAAQLTKNALAWANSHHYHIVASCWFVDRYQKAVNRRKQ